MGLILNAAMKRFADDHPRIDTTHCINRSQKRLVCRACIEICPMHVYDEGHATPPKWNACQNCGLCVTACKTRCIAPSPTAVKRHALLKSRAETTVISCRRSSVKDGHKEDCLAQLPWELLATLALGGRLELDLAPCETCPEADCRALLEAQTARLAHFLGERRFDERVSLVVRGPEEPLKETGVSRRDFFRSLASGGKKTAMLALADSGDGLLYRRRLRERTAACGDGDFGLHLPWLTDRCYACGLCAQLCPNGAIEVGERREGRRPVIVDPVRCTGCGVCRAVCLDGGIEDVLPVRLSGLDRVLLGEAAAPSCAVCGRTIKPGREDGLCPACRIKAKKR